MSESIQGMVITLEAQAAVDEFRAVKVGTADFAAAVAVDGDAPIVGITLFSAGAGEHASVQITGVARAKAGGNVTRGALVTAGAAGVLVASTAGDYSVGVALTSAASGDEFSVLLGSYKTSAA